MAGIQAAKTLHENGVTDFIVLEASSRIGGRMMKADFAGVTIEKGAGWIHDIETNPLYELAQKYGLSGQITTYSDYAAFDSSGVDVTTRVVDAHNRLKKTKTVMNSILMDKLQKNGSDISIRTGLQIAGWYPDTAADQILEYYAYDFDNADKPDITSFLNYFGASNISAPKKDLFITDKRGFEYIVNKEIEEVLQPDDTRLRFREKVVEIRYTDSGVTVVTNRAVKSRDTLQRLEINTTQPPFFWSPAPYLPH